MLRRVAITGLGVISALGNNVEELVRGLKENQTGVQRMPGWDQFAGLRSFLGAPAQPIDSSAIPRSARRTMSAMSEYAVLAARQALAQADLSPEALNACRSLVCVGSTTGSPPTFEEYFRKFLERGGPGGQLSTSFFKIMNHSVASNLCVGLGFQGAQLAVASACATSTQSIINGWELISSGVYDLVIAGGADELHYTSAAIFDNVHAASTHFNDAPERAPRPFDRERDGLVVSEGAGIVVLEAEEHAQRRGARPIGFVDGGAYFCDGAHMTQPQEEGIVQTISNALKRANLDPNDIGYVNAHGTATQMGDIIEARATERVLGSKVPVSSFKGHLGHTLAACGALEMIGSLLALRDQQLIPTRNLENIDEKMGDLNLIRTLTPTKARRFMNNNFAFGGMNASMIVSLGEDF